MNSFLHVKARKGKHKLAIKRSLKIPKGYLYFIPYHITI